MLSELRTYILADSTVSNLIGSRMYPSVLPQNPVLPAVTYQLVSGSRAPIMRHDDNLPSKRVQIDCWSKDIGEADEVAEAIRSLFHYYMPGNMGALYVAGVFAADERMFFESEVSLHRLSRDYIIWHREGD